MSKGTPRHAIRIDDELWAEVKAEAAAQNIHVSELIRQLLKQWIHEGDK